MPTLRCLVTGGAGFIGSHLSESLLRDGHHVTIVDDLSTGSAANLAQIAEHPQLKVIEGSIGDPEMAAKVCTDVDRVYHLAAAVGVALIAEQPVQTIERNVYPTQLILNELANRVQRGESVRLFVASTSEVYGKNPKSTWSEEDDLVFGATTRPRWSYGVSKAIDEFLGLAFFKEHQLPIVIGRFFNVVGPRQTGAYGMVLPRFVQAALEGRPLMVHHDGAQTRCFAHVDDVVDAVVRLVEHESAAGGVYNIGSDQPVSILDLANLVIQRTGSSSEVIHQSYEEAYDASFEDIRRRVPDLGKIRSTIEYAPQNDLNAIIDSVTESIRG
ncbi:MAG: GDP-mannose 4,6-dehydratase [Planctomycetota bacterium]